MSPELVYAILGSGGLGAAVSGLATARNVRAKLPAERDSIVAQGAQTAVQSLSVSLAAETERADRAEADAMSERSENTRLRQRIELLEGRLDVLQSALDATRDELHAIRDSGTTTSK